MTGSATDSTDMLLSEPFVQQLQQAACETGSPIQPIGNGTKSGLVGTDNIRLIRTSEFQGIVTYDPSEFLITAKSGTKIADLASTLAQHGQYLPFDPLFVQAGATLGGTIASGVSGPDRLLYGGARDFIMEVALVDGLGRLARGGGKVVKNAAGFDTPKLMVGSYGRLGVIIEATLKVFPTPQAHASLLVEHSSIESALRSMQKVLAKPLPISSVLIDSQHTVCFRVAGPSASLEGVLQRIKSLVGGSQSKVADDLSQRKTFIDWIEGPLSEGSALIRIGVDPTVVAKLNAALNAIGVADFHHAGACSVTWVKLPAGTLDALDTQLTSLGLSGVVVRGSAASPFVGNRQWLKMASKIQVAMDPEKRFIPWE
jgi:glycolate oxidase FAD binding subunit